MCSYELTPYNYKKNEVVQLDVTSTLNTEIFIYLGEESLQTGTYAKIITNTTEQQNFEFSPEKTLYLVTTFTSDKSRFMIKFRKGNRVIDGIDPEPVVAVEGITSQSELADSDN